MRNASAWGGLQRARLLLWPADLPAPHTDAPLHTLPGVVHPLFTAEGGRIGTARESLNPTGGLDVPETYILYHGPAAESDLRRLLNAWSWAAGSIGGYYPLLLVGLEGRRVGALVEEYGLGESVRILPRLPLPALAALYWGCSALFHPAALPAWGGPVRMALACGKPVVALESRRSDALVGAAAYLAAAQPGERLLGSALLTVIVEESLASGLSQAARQRAAAWDGGAFKSALGEAYRSLVRAGFKP